MSYTFFKTTEFPMNTNWQGKVPYSNTNCHLFLASDSFICKDVHFFLQLRILLFRFIFEGWLKIKLRTYAFTVSVFM